MLYAGQISNLMAIVAGAAAGVMMVIAFGHFLAAARRFRPRRFCRGGAAAFLFFAVVATIEAQKATNAPPRNAGAAALTRLRATDADATNLDDDEEEIPQLRFENITLSNGVISLTIARDAAIPLVADTVQILATDCIGGYWDEVARSTFQGGAAYATVSLPTSALEFVWFEPENPARFFRLEAEIDEMRIDRDGDGLTDRDEDALGTNPRVADTDGDGLSDGEEFELGTDPLCADTDGDGVSDGAEVASGSNPLISSLPLAMPPGPHFELIGTNIYMTVCDDASASAPFIATTAATALSNEVIVAGVSYAEDWAPPYDRVGTGLVFRALHTGYFNFKLLEADDSAEIAIGGAEASGAWQGETPEAFALFVAGRDYPIRITSRNEGGPARLAFARFGEFTPITNASLSASFSQNSIIFEKYFDSAAPGQIRTNSTETAYCLQLYGGQFGGECLIIGQNLDCLEEKNQLQLPCRIIIPPGETYETNHLFSAKLSSSQANDISIAAIFTENFTRTVTTNVCQITAYEIISSCRADFPADKSRHRIGVAEKVDLTAFPSEGISIESKIFPNGGLIMRNSRDDASSWTFSAPRNRHTCSFCAYTDDNESLKLEYKIIEPKCCIITNVTRVAFVEMYQLQNSGQISNMPVLYPGMPGVVGKGEVYLFPTNVSFSYVRIFEDIAPATDRTGVFTDFDLYPDSLIGHNYDSGAGSVTNAITVGLTNKLEGLDYFGACAIQSNAYEFSQCKLKIPVKWFIYDPDSIGDDEFIPSEIGDLRRNLQILTLYPSGNMRVWKCGATVLRQINQREESIHEKNVK